MLTRDLSSAAQRRLADRAPFGLPAGWSSKGVCSGQQGKISRVPWRKHRKSRTVASSEERAKASKTNRDSHRRLEEEARSWPRR